MLMIKVQQRNTLVIVEKSTSYWNVTVRRLACLKSSSAVLVYCVEY